MKPLTITSDVYQLIPNMIILTGIVEIGKPDTTAIKNYLQESWKKLGAEIQIHGLKTHPFISQWRAALQQAGISMKNFPLSIEAIAKRAASINTPFSINPIVDTYNALSMDLALPFGAYDGDQMNGGLQLRTSAGGELFYTLGSNSSEETLEQEIVYSDTVHILTRQFLWRQAEQGKITPQTKRLVFVCELLEEMGEEILQRAQELIPQKFKTLLGTEVSEFAVLQK